MNKKIMTFILAAAMLLTSCGNGNENKESEAPVLGDADVKRDYNFSEVYKKQEDAIYTIQYEPIAESNVHLILGMDILEGYDAAWLPETDNTENFYILREEDNKMYSTSKLLTAPKDMEKYYNTTDQEKIKEEMKSTYFTVADVHDGLLNNAVNDFGHPILTDWTGKFGDYDYYFLEFIEEDLGLHSMRFMVGNSKIDKDYWSYSFNADIPLGEQQLIDDFHAMLFSLREWH